MTLKEVFDEEFKHVKFDNKLAKSLYSYQLEYINTNREYLEFFGSNLLGVHVIRFKDSDLFRFYNDVLDIDYDELNTKVKQVDTINHEFKISGDVLNLTLMYIIHRLLISPSLSESNRKRAAYDAGLIFFYRCTAALLSYYFRFPADPKIAQLAYANLSNKYLIKRLGSWHKVMDYRSNDLIDKNGLHYKKLITFNDDNATVYAINDSQGRIRDLIKNYYVEFKKVHDDGVGLASTSGTLIDVNGEETTREKIDSIENYVSYLSSIIIDKNSFIKNDIITLISKINTNTSSRMIKQTISWLCDNYNNSKYHNDITDFTTKVVIQSMHLINNSDLINSKRDYSRILIELKNLYLSTRSTDSDLLKIRELGEKLIIASSGIKLSNSLILSTRTSVILYITLRVLIGKNK